MNSTKYIILLCFMYCIAPVNLMDNLYSFIKSIIGHRTSNIDEIEKWSNSLKQVKVVYWRRLYSNLSVYYYQDYLKEVLAMTRCPTHIVKNLAEKYIESYWPSGIATFLDREFNQELMARYNCRRLPSTTISKEVVVVLASDNKHMLEDMIDGLGFVMFFNKGGTIDKEDNAVKMEKDTTEVDETVHLKNDVIIEIDTTDLSEIEKWSDSLKPVIVVHWDSLYTNFHLREENIAKLLVVNGCPTNIANGLAEKYNDSHWPPGIATSSGRAFNKNLMDSYNCRRLRGLTISEEAVIVLAPDNKRMPKEMIDELGFVMFFNKGGIIDKEDNVVEMANHTAEVDETDHLKNDVLIEIETLEISEIEKWSNTLKLAKVVDWGCLYSTPFSSYKDYLKSVLAITRCPTHIANDLAENYNNSHWPPGISTYYERELNKELMVRYNCRRLPSTTISKEVVVVLASDNKTMPEDMIDEIGFVMFFNKGGTIDKEENAVGMEKGTTTKVDETVQLINDVIVRKDRSELSEIEKWSNSLKPAKVVCWSFLYTTLSDFQDDVAKLLVDNGCPTHIANGLAEKYNNSHWPPGISTFSNRLFNNKLMDSYTCRRLPGSTISEEAVIVLASDNKTMPKKMIDELGFVMFFNKGGTVDKEDNVLH